ncbi:NYN domain-containing protein [Acidobacteriota bacterium]
MAYLIDGNNFIGHTSPSEIKTPQGRYSLVSKLLIFQNIKGSKIILVFDGPPDPHIKVEKFPEKYFSVLYPSFEQNADIIIKEVISKQKDLRKFFVVSSDREIRSFARKKRAKVFSCPEFNRQLKIALKEFKKQKELKKNEETLSPLDISHWLEIFQKKKD